jgi:hypothetical protein
MVNGKKGADFLMSLVVFLILTLAFFLSLFLIVSRTGDSLAFHEQVYAKKIALLIDSSLPETTIRINVTDDLKPFLENMESTDEVLVIKDNKVRVKLVKGEGYSFVYFSDYDVKPSVELGTESAFLVLEIKEKSREGENE